MLVLTRKRDQSIMLGHDIEVKVLQIMGNSVRLGIKAPRSLSVHRMEVYEAIIQENQAATESVADVDDFKSDL